MNSRSISGIAFLRACTHLLVGAALLSVCQSSSAEQHIGLDLGAAEQHVLDNGLRVVLHRRSESRSVSMRLAVDLGRWDYPCGRQQTAHFLEHLLFSGTTDHEEEELDKLIESHGGRWNARTAAQETVYEIDIFSPNAALALDTLYEIMTKSEISWRDVGMARDIVHREMGGRPTMSRRWLYDLGVGKGAWPKAWEMIGAGTNAGCSRLETADEITRTDILWAYENYYVPGNMVLVVVGNFKPAMMLEQIRKTFGQIPPRKAPKRAQIRLHSSGRRIVVNSHFSPILDSDASVFLAFPTPGRGSPDWSAFRVLKSYLDKRLYKTLRIDGGFAYAPGAANLQWRDFGLMAAYADVYVENMDVALKEMEFEIMHILFGHLKESEIEGVKSDLLLAEARKYERNSDFAEYYVRARHSTPPDGEFFSEASQIAAVTLEDIDRVTREYMHLDRGMVIRVAPTLTYSQLGTGIAWTLTGGLLWVFYRRCRRKRAKKRQQKQ